MKRVDAPPTSTLAVRVHRRTKRHQPPAVKPVMLLVLGMHRSGTSVATRLLECLGAVPSLHLQSGNPDNPEGFFEDRDIMLFNDRELLPALGRRWQSTCPVDWSRLSTPHRARLALAAVAILRKNFPHHPPLAVLKEPRIGLLLPFWLSVLGHADYDVRVVCVLRDPLSIARSLAQRDGLSISHSGLLFITYWFSILSCIRHLPTAFLQYDEILADPARSLTATARKLGIPLPNSAHAALAGFRQEFMDPRLRHHQTPPADLGLEPDLAPLALDLYQQLLRSAQAQNISAAHRFAAQKAKDWELLLPAFAELDQLHERLKSPAPSAGSARYDAEHFAKQRGTLAERITSLETEKIALEAKHSDLVTRHSSLLTSEKDLASRHTALESELQLLRSQAAERGTLAERITSLETEKIALEAKHSDLVTRHSLLVTSEASLSTAYQELESKHKSVTAERDALKQNVEDRFRELAKLTKRLVVSEAQATRARRELALLTSSFFWTITAPLREVLGWFGLAPRMPRQLHTQVQLIRQSGLFDETFYLCSYPDVADAGIDPIVHYLEHGSEEGRNPSASFDTRTYLNLHPDVAAHPERLNPLVHYIKLGRAQGLRCR
jgi:hypothetical protein